MTLNNMYKPISGDVTSRVFGSPKKLIHIVIFADDGVRIIYMNNPGVCYQPSASLSSQLPGMREGNIENH